MTTTYCICSIFWYDFSVEISIRRVTLIHQIGGKINYGYYKEGY